MIVVMKAGATREKIDAVVKRIEEMSYRSHIIEGVERTVIGAVGDERGKSRLQVLDAMEGVENVVPILKPYKLASTQVHPDRSVISVDGASVGGEQIGVIAGPCSVENRGQILQIAREIKSGGATMLRGGAFKPRTSPYSFQGLGEEGLQYLAEAREETGLPIVTEVMNPEDVDLVERYADVCQIGARNVQNFSLLKRVGQASKPVFLKRGMMTTLEEFLMSAEYVLSEGNPRVILCERGIRTFETATRNTLDISAVPVLQAETHLPVFVDPSHACGNWRLVNTLARAAVAVGADGLMIEVHANPAEAMSDGGQSLKPKKFAQLMKDLVPFVAAAGRSL